MAKKRTASRPTARTALIVLGMHRSGTSALAGVLAKMGADLPQDLMEPAEQNAKGFFESNRITGLNEELLNSAGRRFYSYDPVWPDWFASPKAVEFEERALEALDEDYGRSHLFVVKDPRMCRLLPFWHRVFARTGCRVLHVCTHRNPLEVAASMNRVSAYETDYAVNLWLRHVLEAEEASRGYPRVFTSYDRLMADSVDVVTRVGVGLDLKWPRDPRSMSVELNAFLSRDLRNFHTSEAEPYQQDPLPTWVQEALEILEHWVSNGEDKKDYARLDHLRAAVSDASPAMSQSVWQNQEKRWRLDGLQKQLAEAERNAHQARQEAASHVANHAAEQQSRVAVEARVAELDQALNAARAEAEALQANHVSEQQARAAAETKVAKLEQALEAARSEAEAVQANHAAEQQSRVATEAELHHRIATEEERYHALAMKHDALDKTFEKVSQEHNQLCSRLEQIRAEANDLHNQTLSDAQKITELESSLQKLQLEHAALRRKSKRESRHLSVLTQQLAFRISKSVKLRLNSTHTSESDQDVTLTKNISPVQVLEAEKWEQERHSMLSEWSAERARIEQACAAAKAHATMLDQKLKAAQADAEALQANHVKARQAQAETESYNKALLTSTSWRITAPLRYVVQRLRGD